jgi:hypothetical protein
VLSQDLIDELASAQELPEVAIARAVLAPEEIAAEVLRVLALAADGADLIGEQENLLFWGIHVLGAARDQRACAPLLRLLRQPADRLERLLGDAEVATLPKIVAGAFDGDVAALQAVLADRSVDEMLRMVLFGTLAFLVAAGRIDREDTTRFLERFYDESRADRGDAAWVGWEEAVVRLGLRELVPRLEAGRRGGSVPTEVNDRKWLFAMLKRAEEAPDDLERFHEDNLGYIEDVLEDLAWTRLDADEIAALEPDSRGTSSEEEDFGPADYIAPASGDPLRNPLRHVGRNDPCPCGSGKKFKKCCMGK